MELFVDPGEERDGGSGYGAADCLGFGGVELVVGEAGGVEGFAAGFGLEIGGGEVGFLFLPFGVEFGEGVFCGFLWERHVDVVCFAVVRIVLGEEAADAVA